MNNAQYVIDNIYDLEIHDADAHKAKYKEEEAKLIKIIEAVGHVSASKDWQTLSDILFKNIQDSLERRLKQEALKKPIDEPEIYRLQGQLAWAKSYTNLQDLLLLFKKQLEGIRKQL